MITKDKKVMCDSCHKEITGEPSIVQNNGRGWSNISKKVSHFHPTSLDCSNATEPIKIFMSRGMNNERITNG
jgi:hypothetical protein